MRNKYPGICYRCGKHVEAGAGHFELFIGRFRVQHAECAIEHRGIPDPARAAHQKRKYERAASGTGRAAQRARRKLRDLEKEKIQGATA